MTGRGRPDRGASGATQRRAPSGAAGARKPRGPRNGPRSAPERTAGRDPDALGDAARQAAAGLLTEVLEEGRSFDRAFAAACSGDGRLAARDDRDRAFVRALCMAVLRHLRPIDATVADRLARPLRPGKASSPAIAALRLGAAQILYLDVPDHAAVHSSVAMLPPHSPFRGLVNAVLRRIAGEKAAILAAERPLAALPDWLRDSWLAAYGADRAAAIATASLAEAPLDITVRSDAGGWAERLEAERLSGNSLRRAAGGRIEGLPGFRDGAWWVQDAAAALPARALATTLRDGGGLEGLQLLDMCAAPGGKTAQLAAMGASVTALDQDPARLARLTENLARLGLSAETAAADAAAWPDPRRFDGVLLDAPCSATGTLRRHPDILHLRRAGDIAAITAMQDRLLDAAIARLSPGAPLLYCVCSLQPEEGPQRIAAALSRHPDLCQVPLAPAALGLPAGAACGDGLLTAPDLWPERGGLDGFYLALLRTAD
ncbi:RsmB/NOP family class I SAM-dependent RNA methyltransferase [Marinibaculum pumilum]|uniref:RsmB/NOP family class I SAM-dependent RNA methyltransferase n=1 Tax=Marinibaculum pumilum TaxID=1766165 RepID=A0ABV7KXU1_9PROT